MRHRIRIAALAATFLAGVTGSAQPGPTPSALAYTKTTLEQTRTIIDSDRTHDQQLSALHELLDTFLDTDTMGRSALGEHAGKFSPPQLKEFLTLFRELFQRTYVQKLLLFDRPDFEYVGEEKVREKNAGYVRVDTLILTPRDEFAVAYKFHSVSERWQAYEIQIEDLSLTTNFRRQLDSLLSKSSVDTVLGRMRRKYGSRSGGDKP